MGCYGLGYADESLAEFDPSGGKKVVVDFLVDALKVHFSVGVPGVLQSMMEGVHTRNGVGWKLRVRLIHGYDLNASRGKAVSLEVLDGLRCLKSFVRLLLPLKEIVKKLRATFSRNPYGAV